MTRQGIRSCKLRFRNMGEMQVEVHEIKEPSSLMMVQALGGTEEGKVFMIGENLDGEWRTMEVMMPSFEGTNNREEFMIINIIVAFRQRKRLRQIGARVPFSIGICLEENRTRRKLRGICSERKGLRGIRKL